MADLTIIQRFKMARAANDNSVQDIADEFDCSRSWVYECVKYPEKNPDIHKRVMEYINEAGISVPDHDKDNLAKTNG